MQKQNKRARLRGAAAVFTGTMIALFGVTGPAHAAPVVDDTRAGSLTVHKYEKPDTATGLPNNGTAVPTGGLTPLSDVEFTLQQVSPVDLGTNAGWQAAQQLSEAFDPADPEGSLATVTGGTYSLGAGVSKVTSTAGEALFQDLALGLYLVTETSYPAGVTPSAPFLVTVPLTDPDNRTGWLYDVHVYPKNSVITANKTVKDSADTKLGDRIEFTITADIPNEDIIDGYKIVDALDAKLGYVSTEVTLDNNSTITEGTHYIVSHDKNTHTVTVKFTEAGRQILTQNHTAKVQAVITTTVNAVGEIANQALVYPNGPSFEVQPGQPGGPVDTPPVTTKWGEITIQKVNENAAALAGAQFSVYPNLADAKAGTNAIELGGNTIFSVDANGELTISGLRYSDWANNQQVSADDEGHQSYFLVEITAPDGYELLATPIEFEVTAATTAVGIDQQIENVPSNAGFNLPMTGGSGTTMLYLGGSLLVAGAALLFTRSRRRVNS